ncbi:MAG: alpha/beta hydrolase [Solirubrobacteraceae bacterium]|jgi:acetyl esterase/lipase
MSRARLVIDVATPRRNYRYGFEQRSQCAELWLPRGGATHPVVVAIHGGSWTAGYGKLVMRGLAGDLVRRGFAVWNVEYRRVGRGQGGGWPATFADVAAAIDALAGLQAPLDLEHVTLLGHSAGATLALWAGGREALPEGAPGARPLVRPVAVIAQAAPAELATLYRVTGGGAVGVLMGGSPDRYPERYALADPITRLPLRVPVLLVHGIEDRIVSVRYSRSYARAARAAGGEVELVELEGAQDGRHRAHVDPESAAWTAVTERLEGPWRDRVRGLR